MYPPRRSDRRSASVSVSFRYIADGQETRYEVWREWTVRESAVRETVTVTKDEVIDSLLSEQWNDFIEGLIPLGISQLFFFDAEKIRFLADDETDTEALGAAIRSLLGLDLAERLIADASIVERRLSESILGQESDEQSQLLKRQLEAISPELSDTLTEQGSLENRVLRAKSELDQANAEFASVGGDNWSRRVEIETRHQASQAELLECRRGTSCAFAAGELPLLLVPELLAKAVEQDEIERETTNAAIFHEARKETRSQNS